MTLGCEFGKPEIVKEFLKDSRVSDSFISQNPLPFYDACKNGHVEIVKELLKDPRIDINKNNKSGENPFLASAINGHLEIVKWIFASGRKIDFQTKPKQKTPLEQVKAQITLGRKPNETEEGFIRRHRNCPKIVKLLKAYESDPEKTIQELQKQLFLTRNITFLFLLFVTKGKKKIKLK